MELFRAFHALLGSLSRFSFQIYYFHENVQSTIFMKNSVNRFF